MTYLIIRAKFTNDNVNFSCNKFEQIVITRLNSFRWIDISGLLRDDRGQLIALGAQMEYPIGVIIWVVIKITDQTIFWPNLSSQRRCYSFTTLPFMAVVLYKKIVIFLRFSIYLFLDCMFLHVTYGFQSESTLYSCMNVKELLAQMHRTDKYSEHSSIIWSVWPNGWVFVFELTGSGSSLVAVT